MNYPEILPTFIQPEKEELKPIERNKADFEN
jgi:hypothetical protein